MRDYSIVELDVRDLSSGAAHLELANDLARKVDHIWSLRSDAARVVDDQREVHLAIAWRRS